MIRAPLEIASFSCFDVPSIFLTTPCVCSNCEPLDPVDRSIHVALQSDMWERFPQRMPELKLVDAETKEHSDPRVFKICNGVDERGVKWFWFGTPPESERPAGGFFYSITFTRDDGREYFVGLTPPDPNGEPFDPRLRSARVILGGRRG